ncbi:MAG TPA: hypothetical protein VNN19_10410 [bacterium]|nr:hypothetical protein [bacterium]
MATQGLLLLLKGRPLGALRPEALQQLLDRASGGDRIHQPIDALFSLPEIMRQSPQAGRGSILALPLEGDRPGNRVPEEIVSDRRTDGIQERSIENLVSEQDGVRADRGSAVPSDGTAVEADKLVSAGIPVGPGDRADATAALPAATEVRENEGRRVGERQSMASGGAGPPGEALRPDAKARVHGRSDVGRDDGQVGDLTAQPL